MADSYQALGLDPERGIGKAAAVTYEGPPSGLAEFVAEQFDYLGPANPIAAQVAFEHDRLDQAAVGSGSVGVPTEQDALATAEAAGDFDTAMQIKGAQIARMMRGR
jgi:hypothetical protein